MKKILLSGFGPFLDIKNNPSETVVRDLAEKFELPAVILPVLFGEAFQSLKEKCLIENPDLVVMLGVATTRSRICIEKVGLNWVESKSPDVAAKTPATGKIDPSQELALMTSIDLQKIMSSFDVDEQKHIEISFSAGAYVCNDLYFRMLNEKSIPAKKLFIHIPPFASIGQFKQIQMISRLIEVLKEL